MGNKNIAVKSCCCIVQYSNDSLELYLYFYWVTVLDSKVL